MFDVCIIGAGVVGCAIARELAQLGLSVAVIEKHDSACKETSALNSRVIHSGFHEVSGSLKARLAFDGSKQILAYAAGRSINCLQTGMLIAVPHGSVRAGLWKETGALWNMWRQGRRQNIPFRFILSPAAIRAIAPVRALGGIFIPSVCVIDLEAFVKALVEDAKTGDAQFFFGHEVIGIAFEENNHILQTTAGEVKGRILVNSAGLTAHRVAEMAGCPTYKVEFVRGDYYELIGGIARWNIHTLVYPAMPPHARSKGMHFGPRTDGRLYVGPSATLMPQEAPKELFVEAARKFLPDVKEGDLQWAYAGVRPKLLVSNGKPDFTIRMDSLVPPVINLVGIDSPGLSASMAIARYVAKIVLNAR